MSFVSSVALTLQLEKSIRPQNEQKYTRDFSAIFRVWPLKCQHRRLNFEAEGARLRLIRWIGEKLAFRLIYPDFFLCNLVPLIDLHLEPAKEGRNRQYKWE